MSNLNEFKISIAPSGNVRMIYDDEHTDFLNEIGETAVARASHVEPTPGGGWTADLSPVGGPVLGPFPLRKDALTAELAYLDSILF